MDFFKLNIYNVVGVGWFGYILFSNVGSNRGRRLESYYYFILEVELIKLVRNSLGEGDLNFFVVGKKLVLRFVCLL